MSNEKKSFVLYNDFAGAVELLPDELAGELFKQIFAYVNGQEPVFTDRGVKILFTYLRTQLDRDKEEWEEEKQRRSLAGRKSAALRNQAVEELNRKEQG